MRVFITGATGFIGRRLLRDLLRRGDQVVALTRDRRRMSAAALVADDGLLQVVEGDPAQAGPWLEQLAGCDAVVALAGEPIGAKRLSAALKERAERSRVGGMTQICEALGRLDAAQRPRVLLAASAVGYYGPRGDEPVTEEDGPGEDYLAGLCQRWEAAARPALDLGLRVAWLRIGVVLGEDGALNKMVPAFRFFLGGPIGSGRQYFSWIHVADVVGIIKRCLEAADAGGPVNVTAPSPVTMREFAETLGAVLHRPAALPVPALLVRLLLGDGADVLLTGQRVLPRRAQQLGYRFQFPELRGALADLLKR